MKTAGRPKKPAYASKTDSIELRVASAEKRAFQEAAEIAGIGLSTWMRERLRSAAIRELETAGRRVAFVDPIPLDTERLP